MTWNLKILTLPESDENAKRLLREAYKFAWENSEDLVTQTGAVIVKHPNLETILAYGTNHFPRGLNPTDEQKMDKKFKYEHIIHAEPACIYDAARKGNSTQDSIMFMPWVPCTPCAKAIVDAGIKTLIGHQQMIEKTPKRWIESTEYALSILEKAGVSLFMYDGKIGDIKALFDGSEWEP